MICTLSVRVVWNIEPNYEISTVVVVVVSGGGGGGGGSGVGVGVIVWYVVGMAPVAAVAGAAVVVAADVVALSLAP